MSPVAPVKSAVAEWVKWAVGLAWAVLVVGVGWLVALEHRQTKYEEGLESQKEKLAAHIISAQQEKAAINARLDEQAKDQKQVLTTVTAVAVDVGEIKGYLKHNQ